VKILITLNKSEPGVQSLVQVCNKTLTIGMQMQTRIAGVLTNDVRWSTVQCAFENNCEDDNSYPFTSDYHRSVTRRRKTCR